MFSSLKILVNFAAKNNVWGVCKKSKKVVFCVNFSQYYCQNNDVKMCTSGQKIEVSMAM